MKIDAHRTRQFLQTSEFETLLIEELGWDYRTQKLTVTVQRFICLSIEQYTRFSIRRGVYRRV